MKITQNDEIASSCCNAELLAMTGLSEVFNTILINMRVVVYISTLWGVRALVNRGYILGERKKPLLKAIRR